MKHAIQGPRGHNNLSVSWLILNKLSLQTMTDRRLLWTLPYCGPPMSDQAYSKPDGAGQSVQLLPCSFTPEWRVTHSWPRLLPQKSSRSHQKLPLPDRSKRCPATTAWGYVDRGWEVQRSGWGYVKTCLQNLSRLPYLTLRHWRRTQKIAYLRISGGASRDAHKDGRVRPVKNNGNGQTRTYNNWRCCQRNSAVMNAGIYWSGKSLLAYGLPMCVCAASAAFTVKKTRFENREEFKHAARTRQISGQSAIQPYLHTFE